MRSVLASPPDWLRSLLLGEVHIDDIGPVLGWYRNGNIIFRFVMLLGLSGGIGLELQAEVDRRVDEIGHRGERYDQGRGHAAKAQSDRKFMVGDLQIPEAVLDDDGHLVGESLDQMLGYRNTRHAGLERDV